MRRQATTQSRQDTRTGVLLVLMAFLLPVVLILCFMSVDVAWMLLLRTELRVATDSAARAAGSTWSETLDESQAVAAAQQYALLNEVGGQGLVLNSGDVVFGSAARAGTGRYQFAAAQSIVDEDDNAVRVNASATRSMFAGQLLGVGTFTPHQSATASYRFVDVCLVLDRSSSMKLYTWENSSGLSTSDPRTCAPPEPDSRWVALDAAVDGFLDVLETASGAAHVSVVTYASNYTTPCSPANSLPSSRVDCPLDEDLSTVRGAMTSLSAEVWGGMTEIHSGIDRATDVLTVSAEARPNARKVMIVLTDGHYTSSDPVPYAASAAGQGITVHAVTFSDGANQTAMQDVAAAGGGDYYHAPDPATLNAVFRRLAAMPLMLTE